LAILFHLTALWRWLCRSRPHQTYRTGSKNKGTLVTATCGRRTSTVILTDSQHVILSAILPETIASRRAAKEGVLTEDI